MFDGSKSFWRTREDDKLSGEISILLPDKKKQTKKKKQLHTAADISLVSAAAQLYGDMPKR